MYLSLHIGMMPFFCNNSAICDVKALVITYSFRSAISFAMFANISFV
uniref:Uncharacterized protein n=1 Tax=virus sp. ctpeS3 TaxID=2826815 RepID=A0A8S5R9Y7_9VIRU|nr:MAG TPA: hypothetical protein [virus sp. ctpeS3]